MVDQSKNSEVLDEKKGYIPGSSEKKRAVVFYVLFIIALIYVINTKKISIFEYYHLKQSIGRWLGFVMILILSIVLLLLPLLKYIALLIILSFLVLLLIFIKQAWDGKYDIGKKDNLLGLFPSLGGWIVDLFELEITIK